MNNQWLLTLSVPDPQTPSSLNEDPYATPIKVDPVKIAVITNPLFCSNEVFNDETRKKHKKDLKKCIAAINRTRPKLVVVNGHLEESKKLLARISDSIPVVANEGKGDFYTAWYWGIQVILVKLDLLLGSRPLWTMKSVNSHVIHIP